MFVRYSYHSPIFLIHREKPIKDLKFHFSFDKEITVRSRKRKEMTRSRVNLCIEIGLDWVRMLAKTQCLGTIGLVALGVFGLFFFENKM